MPTTKGSWSRVKDRTRYDNEFDRIFGDKEDEPVSTVHSTKQVRKVVARRNEKRDLDGDS